MSRGRFSWLFSKAMNDLHIKKRRGTDAFLFLAMLYDRFYAAF